MVEKAESRIEKDVNAFLEEWGKDDRFASLQDVDGHDFKPKMLAFCEFFNSDKYSTKDLEKVAEILAEKYAEKSDDISGWEQENRNIEAWNLRHPENPKKLADLRREKRENKNIEMIQTAFKDYIDNQKVMDSFMDIYNNPALKSDIQNAATAFKSRGNFYVDDGSGRDMHNALAFKEGLSNEQKDALRKNLDNMGFKGFERPGPYGSTLLIPSDIRSAAILNNINMVSQDNEMAQKSLETKDITNKKPDNSEQNTSRWQKLKQKAKDIANPQGKKNSDSEQKQNANTAKQSVFSSILNRRARS